MMASSERGSHVGVRAEVARTVTAVVMQDIDEVLPIPSNRPSPVNPPISTNSMPNQNQLVID